MKRSLILATIIGVSVPAAALVHAQPLPGQQPGFEGRIAQAQESAQGNTSTQGSSSAQGKESTQGKSGGASTSGAKDGGAASTSGRTPALLIVPMATAMDDAMSKGCWARLYDTTDFGGNMLTVSGNIEIPALQSDRIAGFEWDRNFDSVIVGPGASLAVWQDDDFKGETTTLRANQRMRDLDKKMGFFEDIHSLRLTCSTR